MISLALRTTKTLYGIPFFGTHGHYTKHMCLVRRKQDSFGQQNSLLPKRFRGLHCTGAAVQKYYTEN